MLRKTALDIWKGDTGTVVSVSWLCDPFVQNHRQNAIVNAGDEETVLPYIAVSKEPG